MKVLVATKDKQGWRKNDFCHCNENELVTYGFECDREKVDGVCGCKRSLIGFDSGKATTTFKVTSMECTPERLSELVEAHLTLGGWLSGTPEENAKFVAGQVEDTLRLWSSFAGCPDGAVMERRGSRFYERIEIRKSA